MFSEYKFLRTKNGITSYAKIVVISRPTIMWQISWNPKLPKYYLGEYGSVIKQATEFVLDEHTKRNGTPQGIEIAALEDSVVDTKHDAVLCAAVMAIWKSLGYFEGDINFVFDEGQWKPAFRFQSTQ
jgi:hypothetical protein